MTDSATPSLAHTITVGEAGEARDIAVILRPGTVAGLPACVWLGGYRSDMTGTKAMEMEDLAASLGAPAIRFDYSGHGASGGAFRDGTISRWLEEALAVLDHVKQDQVVLVGSSMGGWIALRLIQELSKRKAVVKVAGLVLIAPAPDFTSELIEPQLSENERTQLAEKGYFEEVSAYSPEPNIFTRALIEDGRGNRVLTGLIETGCPVHILQGMVDPDVPYSHALKLVEHLPADDVVLTLVRDGDHRLSRPQDIERMKSAIKALITPAA
ncbi:alpha/beta hydrolase [Allorhizobium taibaishanense]|uniref:Palmitoyl-protein thioesterase ABHD10, mitochondrial n=1 Tax=Allorhizobium taibaishanense TaxID=887144 RepID=A0A1Q9A8A4_9HYPH|nr:alpha/beta hydrolase [Allorhizobium taibaishanense]MBB4009676.1 pimeloyl-ACP methyl ester carboxylesterase [Allorhizobium taibaishanense]OLP50813.1 2-hydroxymuconic semialdehyde hydrolase [Allorhizobium taibaishanense]